MGLKTTVLSPSKFDLSLKASIKTIPTALKGDFCYESVTALTFEFQVFTHMKSIRKYPAILEFDLLRSLIMALHALLSDFRPVMAGGTINGRSHDLSLLPLFMGSVADIGFPRTIWEWQEVHRSFSPLFGCRRCGL